MKKYIISLGLNDKDSKTQIVRSTEALYFIETQVAIRFWGGTIIDARGVYKHDDGTIVRENGIRIEILAYTSEEVAIDFCELLKNEYNQESVLLEIVDTNEYFI